MHKEVMDMQCLPFNSNFNNDKASQLTYIDQTVWPTGKSEVDSRLDNLFSA